MRSPGPDIRADSLATGLSGSGAVEKAGAGERQTFWDETEKNSNSVS